MNTSNPMPPVFSSLGSQASAAPTMKALWIAIAFLSLCVLAIGGTLIRQQPDSAAAIVPLTSARAMLAPKQALANSAGMITETKDGQPIPDQPTSKQLIKKAGAAPSGKAPAPVPRVASNTAPAANMCGSCGTVEAVTPVTRQGPASGVGMVGGAVVGGVLGNQVGKGNGRAAATVLGAVGGGWAGNTIEKNMNKTTAYSVRVRMQDGSRRTIEQSSAPMVGSKVTLDGNTMRPA